MVSGVAMGKWRTPAYFVERAACHFLGEMRWTRSMGSLVSQRLVGPTWRRVSLNERQLAFSSPPRKFGLVSCEIIQYRLAFYLFYLIFSS
jgi:hypothetical protein